MDDAWDAEWKVQVQHLCEAADDDTRGLRLRAEFIPALLVRHATDVANALAMAGFPIPLHPRSREMGNFIDMLVNLAPGYTHASASLRRFIINAALLSRVEDQ